MDRYEAAVIFREILSGCKELMDITSVSLTDSKSEIRMKSTGYELHIKCRSSDNLEQCLAPILAKHQLKMAKLKETIIIYEPE